MTAFELDRNLVQRICLNNAEAMDFLANHWSPYVHAIDDAEDEPVTSRFRMGIYLKAAMLYSHPFYLKNIQALRQVVINCTVMYADCVEWEKSAVAWQREYADHNRHCGMEMVVAVASICGGPEHALTISREQRAICWLEHHDNLGEPI